MKNENKKTNTEFVKTYIVNQLSKLTANRLALALAMAAGLVVAAESSHAQGAMATISDVAAGGGVFDYTITLQNTGTTALDSFWYAWTVAGNNLHRHNHPGKFTWLDRYGYRRQHFHFVGRQLRRRAGSGSIGNFHF